MNKFPLDIQGVKDIASEIVKHDEAQTLIIRQLKTFLREAMTYVLEENSEPWYAEAELLLQDLHKRNIDFDNFRFGQRSGHNVGERSPYKEVTPISGRKIGIEEEVNLSNSEDSLGSPWSEEELAKFFGEKLPKKPKKSENIENAETLEEIKDWEAKQDNSNDIYKISARVKNLARQDGHASLTATGEAMCNIYVHVLKELYDFATTIKDKEVQDKLVQLLRKKEDLPANVIMAAKNQA